MIGLGHKMSKLTSFIFYPLSVSSGRSSKDEITNFLDLFHRCWLLPRQDKIRLIGKPRSSSYAKKTVFNQFLKLFCIFGTLVSISVLNCILPTTTWPWLSKMSNFAFWIPATAYRRRKGNIWSQLWLLRTDASGWVFTSCVRKIRSFTADSFRSDSNKTVYVIDW